MYGTVDSIGKCKLVSAAFWNSLQDGVRSCFLIACISMPMLIFYLVFTRFRIWLWLAQEWKQLICAGTVIVFLRISYCHEFHCWGMSGNGWRANRMGRSAAVLNCCFGFGEIWPRTLLSRLDRSMSISTMSHRIFFSRHAGSVFCHLDWHAYPVGPLGCAGCLHLPPLDLSDFSLREAFWGSFHIRVFSLIWSCTCLDGQTSSVLRILSHVHPFSIFCWCFASWVPHTWNHMMGFTLPLSADVLLCGVILFVGIFACYLYYRCNL